MKQKKKRFSSRRRVCTFFQTSLKSKRTWRKIHLCLKNILFRKGRIMKIMDRSEWSQNSFVHVNILFCISRHYNWMIWAMMWITSISRLKTHLKINKMKMLISNSAILFMLIIKSYNSIAKTTLKREEYFISNMLDWKRHI